MRGACAWLVAVERTPSRQTEGMDMMDFNHPARIMAWAESMAMRAVRRGSITQKDYDIITQHAEQAVYDGMWRGNISEELMQMGFGHDKLDDLHE